MATSSHRTSGQHQSGSPTVGDMVAAFYEEAHRVTRDDLEADRLARASLLHAMRWRFVRTHKRA